MESSLAKPWEGPALAWTGLDWFQALIFWGECLNGFIVFFSILTFQKFTQKMLFYFFELKLFHVFFLQLMQLLL